MQSRNPEGYFWHPTSRAYFSIPDLAPILLQNPESRASIKGHPGSRKTNWEPSIRDRDDRSSGCAFVIRKRRDSDTRCASNKPTTRTPHEHEHELKQWSATQQKNWFARLNDSLRLIGSLYGRYQKQICSAQINSLGLGTLGRQEFNVYSLHQCCL